jgi:hypothetical protein
MTAFCAAGEKLLTSRWVTIQSADPIVTPLERRNISPAPRS